MRFVTVSSIPAEGGPEEAPTPERQVEAIPASAGAEQPAPEAERLPAPAEVVEMARPQRSSPPSALGAEAPNAEHQALWFVLARRRPRSVALVAVERDLPVGPLAVALAEVGRRLGDQPVTALVADPCDYGFVTRTTGLLAATGSLPTTRPGASPIEVIVAIPPVTAEPLGLAVAQAVDAVVLCFGLGRTTIDAAREAIELVGRDRIVGCVAFGDS